MSEPLFHLWRSAMGRQMRADGRPLVQRQICQLLGISKSAVDTLYNERAADPPKYYRLAMSAIAAGLPPWSPENEPEDEK